MQSQHEIKLHEEELSKSKKARSGDIRRVFGNQRLKQEETSEQAVRNALKAAAKPVMVKQALLRLIVRHDLPLSAPELPALHTFAYAVNYMAGDTIWTTHQTTVSHIARTFEVKRQQVMELLHQARSRIHLTTDMWHSPTRTELQAITGHWVNNSGQLCKALLGLPEMHNGHAGAAVAPKILRTLERYNIVDKLGYITSDNHRANDTMCRCIAEELENWDPIEHRLRCMGHIINLAAQAFFFAKNKEAVEEAVRQAHSAVDSSIDVELAAAPYSQGTGWIAISPLQKIYSFNKALHADGRLYQRFKELAGKVLRSPNDTRWNSYFACIEDARELRASHTAFIHQNPAKLSQFELAVTD